MAQLLYDETTKYYFISIEGPTSNRLILTRALLPESAYHDPIITLTWRTADTLTIEVDHDFGDGKRVYEFNVRALRLSELSEE